MEKDVLENLIRCWDFWQTIFAITVVVALGLEIITGHQLSKYKDQLVALQNVEIASSNRATEQLKHENLKLQERLAPRKLSPDQRDSLRDKAKSLSRQHLDVIVIGSSREIREIQQDIEGTLSVAGWDVHSWTGKTGVVGDSIVIDVQKGSATDLEKAADELKNALQHVRLECSRGLGFGNNDPVTFETGTTFNKNAMAPIRMYIGPKP